MLRGVFWGFAGFFAVSCAASAQTPSDLYADYPELERPLYPELLIEVDDSFSVTTAAFRDAVDKASKALVKRPDGGEAYDPQAMLPLLADEVELFVARGRLALDEAFVFVGKQPAPTALEIVGRLSRGSDSTDPVVLQRYGMHVFGNLAREPTVGRLPWLDGRVCTASYGRLDWSDCAKLREKLATVQREEWRIAVVTRPLAGEEGAVYSNWPKRYQMVPVSGRQKRSGGSIGIVSPEGTTVFFDQWFNPAEGHFAPYLNDHLCFRKHDGQWKISAVAIRLD